MAKRDLTHHQQKIVKRYYEHQDSIRQNNLAEIVSDLYLAESESKQKQLWTRAAKALAGLKADPARTERIIADRDLPALAKLVQTLDRR